MLREAGPDVGISTDSVGGIAIAVLNRGLRPFLNKWHASLSQWEQQHGNRAETAIPEKWQERSQFRDALAQLQSELLRYTKALADIAGVDEHR